MTWWLILHFSSGVISNALFCNQGHLRELFILHPLNHHPTQIFALHQNKGNFNAWNKFRIHHHTVDRSSFLTARRPTVCAWSPANFSQVKKKWINQLAKTRQILMRQLMIRPIYDQAREEIWAWSVSIYFRTLDMITIFITRTLDRNGKSWPLKKRA